jgi:hypothetical protein
MPDRGVFGKQGVGISRLSRRARPTYRGAVQRIVSATLVTAALTALIGSATAAGVSASAARPSGTLQINASIGQQWRMSDEFCPPGTPASYDCLQSVGHGDIPGLGSVTVTYYKLLPYEEDCFIQHNNTAVIEVVGKGTLEVSRAGRGCGSGPPPREDGPLEFAVSGGSGRYAGASGSLVYRSSVGAGNPACRCGTATDRWSGTFTVPGVEFDTTPPVLSGAVSKTVRASRKKRRVRVRYTVTAADTVDGSLPVACRPRSGSLFKRGRTRVTCSATDSSANTARARFTITVR